MKVDVQDRKLYIVMQALNPQGEWQNIEYISYSHCGNSYYSFGFIPDQYWKLSVPVYDGEFSTMLRLKLTWQLGVKEKGVWKKDVKVVYSNTFPGKINLAQFWRNTEAEK